MKEVDYTLATLSRNLLSQERQELAAADVPGRNLHNHSLAHPALQENLQMRLCWALLALQPDSTLYMLTLQAASVLLITQHTSPSMLRHVAAKPATRCNILDGGAGLV